jgi:NADH-quinone oxidoreductase subunit J
MTPIALAAPALVPLASSLAQSGHTSTGEAVLFWFLAPVMVISAFGLLFARKAVHAAMGVVLVMISLAILYVAQDAPFLGVVQVIVYTGAVMMLFLFVIMLIGVDASDSLTETLTGQRWIGLLLGAGLAAVLIGVVVTASGLTPVGLASANAEGNPQAVAGVIFGHFAFDLEVVGTLLVTAAVGAIVLTHRPRLLRKVGQKERADARVAGLADGGVLTPLPAPGVYARSNAMDVPALGPDGAPLEASVPRVLRVRGQERGVEEVHAEIDEHSRRQITGADQEAER